jgi:aromatase
MTELQAQHSIFASADPATVYDLIADVTLWPALFAPTVNVDVLETERGASGVTTERFRISAMVGGQLQDWTSRRRLDPGSLVIDFEQEHATPPLSRMSGSWQLRPTDRGTTIVLTHRFAPVDESPESVRWIMDVLDANSERELAAIKRATDGPFRLKDLVLTCEDTVAFPPEAKPYDFIRRADRWPDLLPHVEHVDLREPAEGVQDLMMSTRVGRDVHRTRSIRLCIPPSRIVYKQLELPRGLIGHSGAWEFRADGDGRTATSRHTALLDPSAIATRGGLSEIRARVAQALSANSRATLSYAASRPRCEVASE